MTEGTLSRLLVSGIMHTIFRVERTSPYTVCLFPPASCVRCFFLYICEDVEEEEEEEDKDGK